MDNDKKEKVIAAVMLGAAGVSLAYVLTKFKVTEQPPTTSTIPPTTTIPARGSSPSYTVPESTTITTGQQPEGSWAYWAPDAWAGKPPSQWRKFPLNQLNIGYTYNPWGVVFAYPEKYPTTLKQLEFLNYWNSPLQKWIEEHGLESQELALFGIG